MSDSGPDPTDRSRWSVAAPGLASAAAVIAVLAALVGAVSWAGTDRGEPLSASGRTEPAETAPAETEPADTEPADTEAAETEPADTGWISRVFPRDPVVVSMGLYVDGEQVPGDWYFAKGSVSHWIGLRADGGWWLGHDGRSQMLDGPMDQPPAISPSDGYLARVVGEAPSAMLVGADTKEGGESFGGVDLTALSTDPPSRAVAVTDDGLVVAGGGDFQLLWRPLVDGRTVDLGETAPGQVVIGSTDAGLVVNEGEYGETDGSQGAPYLARLTSGGTLARLGSVPRHDVLEASQQWLAYVPPGTIGGEAFASSELRVQRLDGSTARVLTPPEGWLFAAPAFRWETADRLLAPLVTPDDDREALARCRPDSPTCVLVDLP